MSVKSTQPPVGGTRKRPAHQHKARKLTFDRISFMVVFLGIPVVVYAVFVVSPFVQAFNYSLTNWSGFSADMQYIGLQNYVSILHDGKFMQALINSVTLLIVLPFVTIVLALILASFVTVGGSSKGQVRGLRNSSFYRVISFFPYVVPGIVIGLIWAQVYDPSGGLLNGLLTKVGLSGFESFAWLGNTLTALPATMFVMVWGLVGFYMVLFVAAIRGVPPELFEAARIDGAGRFRTLVTITIPLIRDNIQTAYIYMGIVALDAFVYMQALEPGGGPKNSTLVITQELFQTAFTDSKFGMACAMGVVLAIITLMFSAVVFLVNRFSGGTNEAE